MKKRITAKKIATKGGKGDRFLHQCNRKFNRTRKKACKKKKTVFASAMVGSIRIKKTKEEGGTWIADEQIGKVLIHLLLCPVYFPKRNQESDK